MEMTGGRHILDGGGGLHLNIYYSFKSLLSSY